MVEIVSMKKMLILSLLLLCSCTKTLKHPIIVSKPNLNLPPAQSIEMSPVEFKVLHKDNVDEYFEDLNKNDKDVVIFSLTESGYKNLAINIQKIKSFIKQQAKVIKLYKEYYEENKK